MKLGTLLLRDGILDLPQLEMGLKTQVLYGGRLGTNLVELGYLDLETLGNYLAQSLRIPLATQRDFEQITPDIANVISSDLAQELVVIPLGPSAESTQELCVAMVEPNNQSSIASLEAYTEKRIVPLVAPQIRILFYMEKHYGLPRQARFLRQRTSQPFGGKERRRFRQDTASSTTSSPAKRPRAMTAPTSIPNFGYLEICDRIDAATSLDETADALVSFALGRFHTLAILSVNNKTLHGWRLYCADPISSEKQFQDLSLSLMAASPFQRVFATRLSIQEDIRHNQHIPQLVASILGIRQAQTDSIIVPITTNGQIIQLVYAHGFADQPLHEEFTNQFIELSNKASLYNGGQDHTT